MTTPTERWQQVKALFADALEQPTAEREGWLALATDDEAMRAEVVSLLEHAEDDDFLARPAVKAPEVPTTPEPSAKASLGAQDVVRLADLPPYTRLTIKTRRTEYAVVVVAPLGGELLLQGGERFPEPVAAHLEGEPEIAVGRRATLRCEQRRVTTSTVSSILVHPTTD